jgi:hypothetical protein
MTMKQEFLSTLAAICIAGALACSPATAQSGVLIKS